jgi:hypothetical protein
MCRSAQAWTSAPAAAALVYFVVSVGGHRIVSSLIERPLAQNFQQPRIAVTALNRAGFDNLESFL